jgi:putative membrane protein
MNRAAATIVTALALAALPLGLQAQETGSGISVRKDPGSGMMSSSQVRVENISAGDVELVRTMTASNVLSHIMVSDSMEVEIARLGEQRIQDAGLRAFASRLVADHGRNLRAGWDVAADRNIAVQKATWDDAAEHMQLTLSRLQAMGAGPEFDRAFLREQISHHHMAAQKLRALDEAGSTEPIREYVTNTLAAVEDHLREAHAIATRMGITALDADGRPLGDPHQHHRTTP